MFNLEVENAVVNVMADGRCFFSCLYLASSNTSIRTDWYHQQRSSVGFPEASRQKLEQEHVYRFTIQVLKNALARAESDEILEVTQLFLFFVLEGGVTPIS